MILKTKIFRGVMRAFSSESSPNQKICSKLFVAGLSFDTNESALKKAFSPYGEILEVKIIVHRTSYRSLGYGFIKFAKETDAESALEHMKGQLLQGRIIRLEYAHGPRQIQESKPQLKAEIED
ncbi:Glycine-rich RNA-binding protein 4 [Nymphaea thermarum]|nr:Glycine-rich RNA-binding protein 4 [Nymphaea thermarum]